MDEPNNDRSKDTSNDVLKRHLKHQFRRMENNTPPPEELKKDVFSTLDSFGLIADILGLFTVDFFKTEMTILDDMSAEMDSNELDD